MLELITVSLPCYSSLLAPASDHVTCTILSQAMLGVQPTNTAVIDIGSCSGKFCMYASLLGWRSVGIEIDTQRWALSVLMVKKMRDEVRVIATVIAIPKASVLVLCSFNSKSTIPKGVIEEKPALTLVNEDADNISSFDLGVDFVVYLWDRGFGDKRCVCVCVCN